MPSRSSGQASKHNPMKKALVAIAPPFLLAAVLLFLGACVRTEPELWALASGQGRIPALVTAPDGTLVAVCEVNGGLQVGRSSDGGKTWTASSAEALRGLRYPCLVADGRDLLLFASTVSIPLGQYPPETTATVFPTDSAAVAQAPAEDPLCPAGMQDPCLRLLRSTDGGVNWAVEEPLIQESGDPARGSIWIAPSPGRGVTLPDGTLAVPIQFLDPSKDLRAPSTYDSGTGVQTASPATAGGVLTSADHGKTWKAGGRAKDGTTEGALAVLSSGRLMLSLRDNARTGRAVYVSDDKGATWQRDVADGMLSDPVCQGSLLSIPASDNVFGHDLLLFCNPDDERDRRVLTLRMSVNDGYNYPFGTLLQAEKSHGYSCLTQLDPATVGVLFETPGGGLAFRTVPLRDLYPGPAVCHIAIPVIPGKPDVPVAEVCIAPWDSLPPLKLEIPELPAEALTEVKTERGRVYITLQDSLVPPAMRSFTVRIAPEGIAVSGDSIHRIARKVRDKGDDGAASYRIPGLVKTHGGTLVASYGVRWKSGKDLPNDTDIAVSRSTDGGVTWGPMQVVLDMGEWGGRPQEENGIDDPCLLLDDRTGDLLLFGTWHHGPRRSASQEGGFAPDSTGQMMLARSGDEGRTWSEPVNITAQVKDPSWKSLLEGPGIGITMQDGTLAVPLQFRDADNVYSATIIYSRDRGQTWQRGLGQIKRYVNESQIAEIEPGTLMINARDRSISGRRAVYVTSDLGDHWDKHPTDSTLVECFCQASLYRVAAADNCLERDLLFFCNCAHNPRQRRDMTVRLSLDDGKTWPCSLLLDHYHGMGYSCMTLLDPETLGILYESSQGSEIFQAIPIRDIFATGMK